MAILRLSWSRQSQASPDSGQFQRGSACAAIEEQEAATQDQRNTQEAAHGTSTLSQAVDTVIHAIGETRRSAATSRSPPRGLGTQAGTLRETFQRFVGRAGGVTTTDHKG